MSLRQFLALAMMLIAIAGCTRVQAAAAESPEPILPAELQAMLNREYGRYEKVVDWQAMMEELQAADVVCIGEAHYDVRDMETAFEIARESAKHRKIALAVERFSYDLQPRLEHLQTIDAATERGAEIETILEDETYQTIWGKHPFDQSGFPVNTPSQPVFETMVRWAARARIPIIALDVTLADREKGLGEEMARRNAFWAKQIEKFLQGHPNEKYQIIVVGGINHMTNAPDSFPSNMKSDSDTKVTSIGQRDAMYNYLNSTKVGTLAKTYSFDDLIVRQPEFALVNIRGVATFEQPPDYWIAVHTAADWDRR